MPQVRTRSPLRSPAIVVDVPDVTLQFAETFFRTSPSPIAHSCFMRLVNDLPMPDLLPTDFMQDEAEEAWACICLFKKIETKSSEAKVACFQEWLKCEQSCASTNYLFKLRSESKLSFDTLTETVLSMASEKISSWLGKYSAYSHIKYCRHGKRSDTSLPFRDANLYNKWASEARSSSGCKAFVRKFGLSGPDYWSTVFSPSNECSQYRQVPKTVKTERPITVENRWNMYYQLGLGELMVERLHRSRLFSLKSQPDRNRSLAQKAKDLNLCTIDLSSASDRIAHALVDELFPIEWLEPMTLLRSPKIALPDGPTLLISKFSGMGNGFTFPMQTIIFWALTESLCEIRGLPTDNISVFGDDIVAPAGVFNDVIKVFSTLGLEVNKRKSFGFGSVFFESCGGDYLNGVDIRPVFCKERLNDVPTIMDLAKRLYEYFIRHNRGGSHVRRFMALRQQLRRACPPHLRFIGPRECLAFPGYPGEVRDSLMIDKTFDARLFKSLAPIPRKVKRRGDYYSLYVRLTSGGFGDWTFPDNLGYRVERVSAIFIA